MHKIFSRGLLGSNTYLVYDDVSREAMVVDLGNSPSEIFFVARDMGLCVKYLVLTHAHFDHIDYIEKYKSVFPEARVVAHEREVAVMVNGEANVSMWFGDMKDYGYPDMTVKDGQLISLGDLKFRVIHTPGHTPGGICLYSVSEGVMYTGDTLFRGTRGRCDIKFGSEWEMAESLKRLFAMDGDIVFYPGHGGESTIGREAERVC